MDLKFGPMGLNSDASYHGEYEGRHEPPPEDLVRVKLGFLDDFLGNRASSSRPSFPSNTLKSTRKQCECQGYVGGSVIAARSRIPPGGTTRARSWGASKQHE